MFEALQTLNPKQTALEGAEAALLGYAMRLWVYLANYVATERILGDMHDTLSVLPWASKSPQHRAWLTGPFRRVFLVFANYFAKSASWVLMTGGVVSLLLAALAAATK